MSCTRNITAFLGVLFFVFNILTFCKGDTSLTWTMLQPENDSRDMDACNYDDFQSSHLVTEINRSEKIFLNRLIWRKIPLKKLLTAQTPFAELRFDAMKPLILTAEEKVILREYLARGGFLLLIEDAYPYSSEDRWIITSWAIIDFITKELPALDSGFRVQTVDNDHPIFHQYFNTQIDPSIQSELDVNPRLPYRTLLSYRDHPAAFVTSRFFRLQGKLCAQPKPYPMEFAISRRGYQLLTNVYVYAALN